MFKKVTLFIKRLVKSYLGSKKIAVTFHNNTDREPIIELANIVYRETHTGLSFNELIQLYMTVRSVEKVDGDIAEVGVFMGGTAKVICEAKGLKSLHLFDTFEGLPDVGEIDADKFHVGQYESDYEHTVEYLRGYENVYFYKGIFPETSSPVRDKQFSLVHLDVDTFKSTLACLEFFYPRMNRGGLILSHDYSVARGVRKAYDDFFSDKPETVVRLSESQCIVRPLIYD